MFRAEFGRSELAVMSLDIRGRLVANKDAVFANQKIAEEIRAAQILGRALDSLNAEPVTTPPVESPASPSPPSEL